MRHNQTGSPPIYTVHFKSAQVTITKTFNAKKKIKEYMNKPISDSVLHPEHEQDDSCSETAWMQELLMTAGQTEKHILKIKLNKLLTSLAEMRRGQQGETHCWPARDSLQPTADLDVSYVSNTAESNRSKSITILVLALACNFALLLKSHSSRANYTM